ncbi:MAG TPA: NYN domain-containing protein [Gemmatimonadota bacterium]|nr:NYN domain-containing protein [Gemmatimonadota bacterium]
MNPSGGSPRAVLVDGYNLLHAIPRFAPRGGPIEPARAALEAWLAQVARVRGVVDVVLVWDGRAAARASRTPAPLTVLYTSADETADERIRALCRGRFAGRAAETWVVSSDREVQGPARQLGFEAIGAMTFWRRWNAGSREGDTVRPGRAGAPGGAPPGREAPAKPRRATPREVDELLDEFLARGGEEE